MKEKVSSFYEGIAVETDVGLRKYMLSVFSYMSAGLALTAVLAYIISSSATLIGMLFSSAILSICIMLAPLFIAMYMRNRLHTISASKAKLLFFLYAASMGIALSPIVLVYNSTIIATAFFISASMFLSVVIYGYATEKDLTSIGSFLFMGLIGLIISSVVNLFLQNSMMDLVISLVGVIIFTGLTAYHTQTIKSYYFESDASEITEKKAIFGASILYICFINLFLSVLKLLSRRD